MNHFQEQPGLENVVRRIRPTRRAWGIERRLLRRTYRRGPRNCHEDGAFKAFEIHVWRGSNGRNLAQPTCPGRWAHQISMGSIYHCGAADWLKFIYSVELNTVSPRFVSETLKVEAAELPTPPNMRYWTWSAGHINPEPEPNARYPLGTRQISAIKSAWAPSSRYVRKQSLYKIDRRFAPVSKISRKIQDAMKDTHTNV
ncbi:hypothetical protein B0H14DRAFT_2568591 [Mycena olivaceomarginata]|nr:hypothetical protein B0H14DRAFT_2568591 [Mycena olivaceomarginata]